MNPNCIRFNAQRHLQGIHLNHQITRRIFQQIKELSAGSIKDLLPHDQSISENLIIAAIASLLNRQYINVYYEYSLDQWGVTKPYLSQTSPIEFTRRYTNFILAGQLEIEALSGVCKQQQEVEYKMSRALLFAP